MKLIPATKNQSCFFCWLLVLALSVSSSWAKDWKRETKKSNRPDVEASYIEKVKKDWKFIYEKDNISVFKKVLKESPITAFRGIGILPLPMDLILHVVRDLEKSKEWTPNLAIKTMAREISLVEGITYNMNDLPWPATDRESILYSKLYFDEDLKAFNITTKSVDLPDYPEKKEYVRGVVYSSNFILKPVAGGTLVDLDAHIDPKGTLPAWFINFIQEEWAYKFITSLEKFAKNTNAKPELPFTQMLKAYPNEENIMKVFSQFKSAGEKIHVETIQTPKQSKKH